MSFKHHYVRMMVLVQRVIRLSLLVFFGLSPVLAHKVGKVSRFMCTQSNEVNLRRGPERKYPVDWKFIKSRYPLLVIAEYGTWRKVRDFDHVEGWVHQSMLTSKPRRGVIKTATNLYKSPKADSKVIAFVDPKVFVTIKTIKPSWCRVEANGFEGWVPRSHVWGVLDHE